MKAKECFVRTGDNFFGNYEKDTVLLSCSRVHGGGWRVGVWGNDDFGYDLDFLEITDAIKMYQKIKKAGQVSIAWLKDNGFDQF